jgi:hypothetical protein
MILSRYCYTCGCEVLPSDFSHVFHKQFAFDTPWTIDGFWNISWTPQNRVSAFYCSWRSKEMPRDKVFQYSSLARLPENYMGI